MDYMRSTKDKEMGGRERTFCIEVKVYTLTCVYNVNRVLEA